MQNDFPESNWKTLSRLKPLALERLCKLILQESGNILDRAQEGGHYQAYLNLYKHIHASDEKVANCFNDWRRSQALNILASWRSEHLLTDEEFNTFSPETRAMVGVWLKHR
jgi:hypothetical protein